MAKFIFTNHILEEKIMALVARLTTQVFVKTNHPLVFDAEVYVSNTPADRMIEPDFYDTAIIGPHHEMMLVGSPVWGRVDPEVPIHIHQNPDTKRYFVCWVNQLATLKEARELFEWWCVGTVYSIQCHADFAPLIEGKEPADFLQKMKERYGITASLVCSHI